MSPTATELSPLRRALIHPCAQSLKSRLPTQEGSSTATCLAAPSLVSPHEGGFGVAAWPTVLGSHCLALEGPGGRVAHDITCTKMLQTKG
jgi:hypothetical protein